MKVGGCKLEDGGKKNSQGYKLEDRGKKIKYQEWIM